MIRLERISKSFGGVAALREVGLEIKAGRVHGLLGENGAGKSTLMNVLFGLLRPDGGRILVEGREVVLGSPRVAQGLGIGMVHQHFKLVGTLTVLQNLCLTMQRGVGVLRRAEIERRVGELSGRLGWKMELGRRVSELSVGEQQRVEIVRALAAGGKILILDEPTAVLTPDEVKGLFVALRGLVGNKEEPIDMLSGAPAPLGMVPGDTTATTQGQDARATGVGIVFISHKLGEVEAICDEVTILRGGRVVYEGARGGLSREGMAEAMVGARVEMPRVERVEVKGEREVVLRVEGASAGAVGEGGHSGVREVSFELRAGEILGVAGVDGNGQGTLVGMLMGMVEMLKGGIWIEGRDAAGWSVRERVERVAYVPGDRHLEAVGVELDLIKNMMMKEYREEGFSRRGWLRLGAWRGHTLELVRRFDVRYRSVDEPLGTLSGGNQQKVVLARELHGTKRVVVAVNPTRGLDVGATAFVMRQLLAARGRGAGVLLVHSDLDELLAISDRVLVMYNGTLRESGWPKGTKEEIGRMMLGVEA